MSELSPNSQNIVDAARGGVEPSPGDKERVRAALQAKIAAGVGLAAGATAVNATTTSTVTKFIASVVLALGVAAGAWALVKWQADSPSQPTEESPELATPVAVRNTPVVPPAIEPIDRAPVEEVPAPKPRKHTVKRPAPANAGTLREETLLIYKANAALQQGDSLRTLTILREHKKQFPLAALLQEAAAVRIDALCQMGRDRMAKRQTKKFLRRWPRSTSAARVKNSCGHEEETP